MAGQIQVGNPGTPSRAAYGGSVLTETFRRKVISVAKFSGNFRCSDVAWDVAFFYMIYPCIEKEFGRKICKALSRNSGRELGGFAGRVTPTPCASGRGAASESVQTLEIFCLKPGGLIPSICCPVPFGRALDSYAAGAIRRPSNRRSQRALMSGVESTTPPGPLSSVPSRCIPKSTAFSASAAEKLAMNTMIGMPVIMGLGSAGEELRHTDRAWLRRRRRKPRGKCSRHHR